MKKKEKKSYSLIFKSDEIDKDQMALCKGGRMNSEICDNVDVGLGCPCGCGSELCTVLYIGIN